LGVVKKKELHTDINRISTAWGLVKRFTTGPQAADGAMLAVSMRTAAPASGAQNSSHARRGILRVKMSQLFREESPPRTR
jgi:hypothetical protein